MIRLVRMSMCIARAFRGVGLVLLMLAMPGAGMAAVFQGSSRIAIADPDSGLTWSGSVNALTVSCWFKISIPSGTPITNHLAVLANRRTATEGTNLCAYAIRYNIWNGDMEMVARGVSGLCTNRLIERPYGERWYHVAVVQQGDQFTGYVDGHEVFDRSVAIGNSGNADGVTIGGWGSAQPFWGEIQEVAIYQAALSQEYIVEHMFGDQPPLPELKGYFKLGWSTNTSDYYRNFAPQPPTNTDFGTPSGSIVFEETDQAGEQSRFDTLKDGGREAVTPLSGSFAWQQTVLARPTPGVGFSLAISYSSASAYSGYKLGNYDPFGASTVGKGWRHSFDTRIIPGQYFAPIAGVDVMGLMKWDGSIETWDLDWDSGEYRTRHNEYRGELAIRGAYCEWTTPDRLVYRFRHPFAGPTVMRGRLAEIRDFNSNTVRVAWNETLGIVTQVTDTAGGRYDFRYDAKYLLTNVAFQGWAVTFGYDSSNRLVTKSLAGPSAYSNINTCWRFLYNSNGLMDRIVDPRSNDAVRVTYDEYGRKVQTMDALGRTIATAYGAPGPRQVTKTDPAGFTWVETYDRKHHLLSRADPLGNVTRYDYDDRGNVCAVTEPLGWRTTFAYDERANRTAVTNALGQVSRWSYHGFFNKPVEAVNALGWVTRTAYDARGNVSSNWDGLGSIGSYTYHPNGLVKTATDANGRTSQFEYGSDGFLVASVDAAGYTNRLGPNERGWTLAATNAIGQVSTFAFDINGNVIEVTDPLGRVMRSVYDPNGNLVTNVDAKGQTTRHLYDAANQRTQTVDRIGAIWRTVFNNRGHIDRLYDPYSNSVQNAYDDAGRPLRVTDPAGSYVSTEYDANGNVTASMDKLGRRWSKTYDRLNRAVASADPLGNVTRTAYDGIGRVRSVTTPRNHISVNGYDGRNRLTTWTDSGGFTWSYDYDAVGNITNITDALGGRYVMTYGPRNERLTERNQDGKIWRYEFDALLRLAQSTDPNGIRKTITYDDGNRIDFVTYNTGRTDDFGYDDNDNPTWLSRSGSGLPTSSTLQFDPMDRLTAYTDVFGKTVQYTNDLMGRVAMLVYPAGFAVNQRFDALSRLTSQTDSAGRQMTYAYDRADRLLTRRYPNGVVQSNAYDFAGRLTGLSHTAPHPQPSTIDLALRYAYDRNGNRTTSEERGGLAWSLLAESDESARYTGSGRLMDRTVAVSNQSSVTAYEYDESGNLTNSASTATNDYRFTYDEQNRVISVRHTPAPLGGEGHSISNRYDALGRRVSRVLDGVETRYTLDIGGSMERILCDFSGSQPSAWYVHGPGGLAYKVDHGGSLSCYHADGTGHVRALTDSVSNSTARYAYSDYGRQLPGSSTNANPYKYVGALGVMEELPGLIFMRARYFGAADGVFVSEDIVRPHNGHRAMARYAYSGNSPLSRVDPNGQMYFYFTEGPSGGHDWGSGSLPRYAPDPSREVKVSGATICGTYAMPMLPKSRAANYMYFTQTAWERAGFCQVSESKSRRNVGARRASAPATSARTRAVCEYFLDDSEACDRKESVAGPYCGALSPSFDPELCTKISSILQDIKASELQESALREEYDVRCGVDTAKVAGESLLDVIQDVATLAFPVGGIWGFALKAIEVADMLANVAHGVCCQSIADQIAAEDAFQGSAWFGLPDEVNPVDMSLVK